MVKVSFNLTKRRAGVVAATIFLLACIAVAEAQTGPTSTVTLSGGPQPGAPTYTIFSEVAANGTTIYYAKNAYGAISWSSTNASYVFNSALNSANGIGTVMVKPGRYTLTNSITPIAGNTFNAMSLVGEVVSGKIGDVTEEKSAVELVAGASFPANAWIIDYEPKNSTSAVVGVKLANLGISCDLRACGVKIANPREFVVENLNIEYPATPPAQSGSPTGGFNAVQYSGTATAYDLFNHITVAYSQADGFCAAMADCGIWTNNFAMDNAQFGYSIAGNAKFIANHAEGNQVGWNIAADSQIIISESSFFGVSSYQDVRVTPTISTGTVIFTACSFSNNPDDSADEQSASMVEVFANAANHVSTVFQGCAFYAGTYTSHFVYIQANANATVNLAQCVFYNTPTGSNFEDNGASLTVTAATGLTGEDIPTANKVLYCNFDEYDTTKIFDYSGNTNTGTMGSPAPSSQGGKYGSALYFNGSTTANIPHTSTLNLNGSFTVGFWLYINTTTGRQEIITKTAGALPAPFEIYADSDANTINIIVGNSTGGNYQTVSHDGLVNQRWQYWAFTYNAPANRLVTIYLNGTSIYDYTIAPLGVDTGNAITMGVRADAYGSLTGFIDELSVFNVALTDAQVAKLYAYHSLHD